MRLRSWRRCDVQLVQFLVILFADRCAGGLLFLDGGVELPERHVGLGGVLADLLDVAQAQFFRLPLFAETRLFVFQFGNLLLDFGQPVLRGFFRFLGQLPRGQLQLAQTPLNFVDRGRNALQLHRQPAGGFVHQVDRLVGQEAVGDVAMRQLGGCHQRRVLDLDAVVGLVARLQAAQDGDGVLHVGFADVHRLETTFQRRVLFDVLAVLVQRRGPDAAQFAAGQGRLQQVGGVGAAFGSSGPDDRVQFVDEQDHVPAGILDFAEHGLQPLLELAAEFRARDHGPHVQGDHAFVLQALRNVALHHALRQALGDGRLANARLADQHRVVLGAARQDLDHAADLSVAADHRVQLALGGQFHQVDPISLQRLELVLRRLIGDAAAAADRSQRGQDVGFANAVHLQQRLGFARRLGEGQQQVFRGDEVVLHGFGFAHRRLQDLLQGLIGLGRGAAADLGQTR